MAVLVAVASGSGVGSGSISAAGVLTATSYVQRSGSGPVSAAGELTADAIGAEPPAGSGTITAAGALTATGYRTPLGVGTASAGGELVGSGDGARTGAGTVTAAGSLAGGGRRQPKGSGPVSAVSGMTGAGGGGLRQGSGSVSATGVLAGNGMIPGQPLGPRRIVFRIDNRLVTEGQSPASQATISQRLSRYVDDCNTIFAKSTNLVLTYNAATDCTFHDASDTTAFPSQGYQGGALPEDWFFECPILLGSSATSFGGGAGAVRISHGGIGFIGVAWLAIWSNAQTESTDLVASGFATQSEDYTFQLYLVLHELMHNFNVGIGEYYSVTQIRDLTGVAPDLSVVNTEDLFPAFSGTYWDARPLPQKDVMCRKNTTNRADWLTLVEFCPLSSFVINEVVSGNVRAGTAEYPNYNDPTDIHNFEVVVEVRRSSNGTPIQGATVELYTQDRSVYTFPLFNNGTPTQTEVTGADGRATVTWGAVPGPEQFTFSPNNMTILVKASAAGFDNNGDALTAWDINAYEILGGGVADDWHYTPPLVISLDAA